MPEFDRIGFMQGRLSPIINDKIQIFPIDYWKDEFEIAESIGLSNIEWTLDLDTLEHNPLLKKNGRVEIQSLAKKHDISIPSMTCDYLMQKPFWKLNNEKEIIMSQFLRILESCNDVGISIIVVPLVDNGKIENKHQKDSIIKFFEKNIKKIESYKVNIIFESDFKPIELANFINKFDSSFGINYDTGNSASMGYNPSEEISTYGERIMNVHIKDRTYNGTTVPLTRGNCEFSKVFESLKKIKYNSNYILQTARSDNNQHTETIVRYAKMTKKWVDD